jgi:D-3-phosphoglycerate dehydrogenase / 2-oxoglutarate reductase
MMRNLHRGAQNQAGEKGVTKKQVGIRLPKQAQDHDVHRDFSLEMEALAPVADIVEILADMPAEFAEGARHMDALMTSWGMHIDAQIIDALKQCVVIGVSSVGVDMVDVEAATAAGIVVTNVPDIFIEEVADHVMMLLLDAARMTPMMARLAAQGEWRQGRPTLSRRPRLFGQTLGFYGFGNVARCTARRAKPFGLHLLAFDPYVSELEITGAGVEPVGFGELLERSDFVSIHAPHNRETEHVFDEAALSRMKSTAILINTARGALVDEAALADALRTGVIAGAALDVLEHEPPRPDNPLLTMENVVVTPHVAAATTRMRPESRRRAAREVAMVLQGRWPMSCVNPTVLPRCTLERWQPYPMNRGPNR